MSILSSLSRTNSRSSKRVGRGYGSGKGSHTSGRGNKGHKARTGKTTPLWFEGGQLPLVKRLPMMRGKGRFNVVRPVAQITLIDLNNMKATEISLETLKLEGVIDHRFNRAKVIATGSLERAITLTGIGSSETARKAIEKAGGSVA